VICDSVIVDAETDLSTERTVITGLERRRDVLAQRFNPHAIERDTVIDSTTIEINASRSANLRKLSLKDSERIALEKRRLPFSMLNWTSTANDRIFDTDLTIL
jgi:hypothetical protein